MSRSQNADCVRFNAGHGTHYIHARQHARDRSDAVPATLVDYDVEAHRLVIVTATDLLMARHHDIVRVMEATCAGAVLRLNRRWHILAVDNYLANICVEGDYVRCETGTDRLIESRRVEQGTDVVAAASNSSALANRAEADQ